MAEGVLLNVAGKISSKLSSLLSEELGMLWGLKDDLSKLESKVVAIRAVLRDAEARQTKGHFLKDQLEKLEDVLYDADDVLDELSCEALRRESMTRGKNAKQVRIFFSNSNQLAFNFRMAHQVKEVRERLDSISAEKNDFHLNENIQPSIQHDLSHQIGLGTRRDTHSSLNEEEVIGRDDDKRFLKDLLLGDMNVEGNVQFIAIVGMGGIGKTTLAKFLYNDREVSDFFDLKMWVWVSEQFDVKIVVKKIIESATKKSPKVEEMDSLQCELQKVIRGKKYLLVMDDIWNETEDKWEDLKHLLMAGARGSKIMITKRDRKVAAELESMTSLFTLEGLHKNNSWSLFRKVAFKEGKEPTNPNLIKLGEEILEKCGGVPLVIRHVARMLHDKTSEEEWMSFKNKELLEVTNEQNNDIDCMTSILELSYSHLPPHLKLCFAYSSLFPKGYEIEINDLIRQWVAQGFIVSSNGRKSMEDIGKDYFNDLCWRFFYENSSDGFVCMHDVMRELARKVAGNKLFVHGNPNNDYVVGEQTRHISLNYKIESWQDVLSKLCKAKGLRTFLLLYSSFEERNKVDEVVLDALFFRFPRLRVLVLHESTIYTLSDSIEKLRHLRYLDLSKNYDMESLPNSITKLQNLQTLKLTMCRGLKELPRDTCNLVNLRHVDFPPDWRVTHIPEGMEKLSCLQTISLFVLDCNKVSKLNEVNHLSVQLLKIIGLEQLRYAPSEVSSINLKDRKGFRELKLEWKLRQDECKAEAEADEIVMEGLEPHRNIESLEIEGYSGVRLPTWVSNSLLKLTSIKIVNCHTLQHLPPLDHFKALIELYLKDLRSLKFIDNNNDPYSSSSTMFFPSLVILSLENMPNLEGWWRLGMGSRVVEGDQMSENTNFYRRFALFVDHCPKLSYIPKLVSIGANVHICDVGVRMVSTIGPLSCLELLKLEEIKDMECLPDEFQQNLLSSTISSLSPILLKYLILSQCPNLMSLPEWIGILTSLEWLSIYECRKLKSLPEGMRQLKSLENLMIVGCPDLEERCKEGGEDWPKISHVPNIILSPLQPCSDEEDEEAEAIAKSGIGKKMNHFISNICSFFLTRGYEHFEL